MNVHIVRIDPIRVALVRHTGPYDGLTEVFDRLFAWVDLNNVPIQRTIGVYWDNPDHVPARQLRSAACVEIAAGYQVPADGGLKVEVAEITGGTYATARHIGPYEELERVWTRMTEQVESQGHTIRDIPAFEVYENDPAEVEASQLVTDLYLPLL